MNTMQYTLSALTREIIGPEAVDVVKKININTRVRSIFRMFRSMFVISWWVLWIYVMVDGFQTSHPFGNFVAASGVMLMVGLFVRYVLCYILEGILQVSLDYILFRNISRKYSKIINDLTVSSDDRDDMWLFADSSKFPHELVRKISDKDENYICIQYNYNTIEVSALHFFNTYFYDSYRVQLTFTGTNTANIHLTSRE